MTGRISWTGLIAMTGIALAVPSTEACRYSVRDAGFVDFEPAPYRMVVGLDPTLPAGWREPLRQVATASFLDANVVFELVDGTAPPPEFQGWVGSEGDPGGSPGFLVGPDGRVLRRALPGSDGLEALWEWVEATVDSPLRQRLAAVMVGHFAVVLLAEGADAQENARVRSAALRAIDRFRERQPRLPKPVKGEPLLMTVGTGAKEAASAGVPANEVDYWSLGLTPADRSEPELAVVYGRCRRAGPPLRGFEISESAILEILTILGQDCECELDRAWLRGPLMPVRWDQARQREVVRDLGFDAENPMVKAEIARIIARGPSPTARRIRFDEGDPGLFGYAEIDLDDPGEPGDELALSAADGEGSGRSENEVSTTTIPTAAGPAEAKGAAPPMRMTMMALMVVVALVVIGAALVLVFSGRPDA